MKPPQAQLFLEVVLLDAIREDITQNKKLNPQFYECLKRALYKPGAFFKGLIFPMLEVRMCCPQLILILIFTIVGLYLEGSCNYSVRASQKDCASVAFVSRTHAHCGDGLYG
jgi:hypothetical protein